MSAVRAQAEIDAADTADELRALIEVYQANEDFDSMYLAARKLIELDPSDSQAYEDAIDALLSTISGDYQAIEDLIALGIQNAPDGAAGLVEWAEAQNQTFSFTVPFLSDYASESEINTVGSTPGNLTNQDALWGDFNRNGLLTTQGDWVYLMLPNEDLYVYKMRLDGTGLTKVGDARGDNLNIVGDWLYFKNLNAQDMPYRIRTDGTQMEGELFNKAVAMAVSGDWIYYCNNDPEDTGFYKIRTDGSEETRLLDGAWECMSLFDGWIYYCTSDSNSELCRISTEGGEPQKLADGGVIHYSILDGWIYYLSSADQKAVYRMRPDGSEQAEIYRNDSMLVTFAVANGKLVVSVCQENDASGNPYPTEMVVVDMATNTVGQNITASTSSIYVAGDTIFYLNEDMDWQYQNLSTGAAGVIETPSSAASETETAQSEQTGSGNAAANLFMDLEEAGAGLVARDGASLYFGNPSDGYRLYAAGQNGDSGLQKLLDTSVSYVNVIDQTIYYCDTKGDYSICSVGVDGQNRQKLSDGHCEDLSYLDGWLYYHTTDGIFRLPAEGGEPEELLSGEFCCVYAYSDCVYYMEDNEGGGLWRISLGDGEPQSLLTNHHTLFFAIQDDLLYCLIDGGDSVDVIRMNLDGSDQSEVYSVKIPPLAINISGNRLLIVESSKDGEHFVIRVWNLDNNATETMIEGLVYPCAWCFDSDVYYIIDSGLIRLNLDSGERVPIGR